MNGNRFLVMAVYGLAAVLIAACAPAVPEPNLTPTTGVEPSETAAIPTATSTSKPTDTSIPPTDTPILHTNTPRPTRTLRPLTSTPTRTPTTTPRPSLGAGPFRAVAPVDNVIPGEFKGWHTTPDGAYWFGGGWLHTTPDGTLWLYSDQAVARLQADETWAIFLPEYEGYLAGIDVLGRVWVADFEMTEIAVWDGQDWIRYGEESGWLPLGFEWFGSPIQSWVYFDAHGWLWLATVADVRAFDGHQWHIFGPEALGMQRSESNKATYEIQVYEDLIWISECGPFGAGPGPGHGVRWFDGEWHGVDLPLGIDCVTAITVDPAGQIWLGQYDRLWQTNPHGEEWTAFAMPEAAVGDWNFGYPARLTFGPEGDVWATYEMCGGACCEGARNFYHIKGGVWTLIAEFEANYPLPQLLLGADGTLWLFSYEGIDRVIDNVREPAADLIPFYVTQDKAERIWFIAEQDGQNWLWTLDSGE